MRRHFLIVPASLLVLAMVATAARAEDSPAPSRCELTAFPAPQPAAPARVAPPEQPDAALARHGATRWVLEADTNAFRAALLGGLRDDVRCLLREARIAHGSPAVRDGGVEVQLRETSDLPRARAALAGIVPADQSPGAVDLRDGGNGLIRITPTPAAFDGLLRDALDRAGEIIARRLQEWGMTSLDVRRDGADRMVVMLPVPPTDVVRLMHLVTARGRLQFRLLDTSIPPPQTLAAGVPSGSELVPLAKSRQLFLVRREAPLTGRDIADARPDLSPNGRPAVAFTLTARGARVFGRFTQENVGRPFAIVLDGEVLWAPVIREPILGGTSRILGDFTREQADDLAIVLRTGELPLALIPIEQRFVAPAK
jgi:preprotein translocase subunit SecD